MVYTARYEVDSLGIIVAINPIAPIQLWEIDALQIGLAPALTETFRRDFRVDLVTKLVRSSTTAEKVDYDEWKRAIAQANNDFESLFGGKFLDWFTSVTSVTKLQAIRKLAVLYRGDVRLT